MVNHTSLFLELGKVNEAQNMFHLIVTLNNQVDDIVGYGREKNQDNSFGVDEEKDKNPRDSNP